MCDENRYIDEAKPFDKCASSFAVPKTAKLETLEWLPILLKAAERDRKDVLVAAKKIGLNLGILNHDNYGVLHAAAACGAISCIKFILDLPECKHQRSVLYRPFSSFSMPPIVLACYPKNFKSVNVIKALVEGGCDPFQTIQYTKYANLSKLDRNALNWAIEGADIATVKYLWEVMMQSGMEHIAEECLNGVGDTPLHVAASQSIREGQNTEILEYIYQQRPAHLYKKNRIGDTPMHAAALASYRNPGTMKLLIEYSGDSSLMLAENNYRCTPLHYVILNGESNPLEGVARYIPKSIPLEDILDNLARGKVIKALSQVVDSLTPLTEEEEVFLTIFRCKNHEDDFQQIVRSVERLGVAFCMKILSKQAIAIKEQNPRLTLKKSYKGGNVPKSHGGVYLTVLEEELKQEGRNSDLDYIKHLSVKMQKRHRNKPKRV